MGKRPVKKEVLHWNWFYWQLLRGSDGYKSFLDQSGRDSFNVLWNQALMRFNVTFHGKFSQNKSLPGIDFSFEMDDQSPSIVFTPFYPAILSKPLFGNKLVERVTDCSIQYIDHLKQQKSVNCIRTELEKGFCQTSLSRPLPGFELFAIQWSMDSDDIAREIKAHIDALKRNFYKPFISQRNQLYLWISYLTAYRFKMNEQAKRKSKYGVSNDAAGVFCKEYESLTGKQKDIQPASLEKGYGQIQKLIDDAGKGIFPIR